MKLTLLIAIALRLFSIYWAVLAVVGILSGLGMVGAMASDVLSGTVQVAAHFAVPVFYGVLSLLTWIFARLISAKVVADHDTHLSFGAVTAENLYTLGALCFGLYFSLGNLAATLNWIHYLVVNRAGQSLVQQAPEHSMYDITSAIIPCAAGIALTILSPKIGKKLAKAGHRSVGNEDLS